MKSVSAALGLALCGITCNHPHNDSKHALSKDFSTVIYKSFEKQVIKDYDAYYYFNGKLPNCVNFISLYSNFCSFKKLRKHHDYEILQFKDFRARPHNNGNISNAAGFYYEILHFSNAAELIRFIAFLKQHNCIDAFNLKIHCLYRLSSNEIICLNYYGNQVTERFNKIVSRFFGANIEAEIFKDSGL